MRAMEIANPIYDAAFKYLMRDRRVARLVIAKITGLEVESVEFRAQEVAASRERPETGEAPMPPLALFRMDFVARVQTPDGLRQVLVEIQKAKAPTVVERFRVYLGEQYASAENMTRDARGREEAVPIVTVYLLGYDLGLSDEPVLDALPRLTERRTGRALDAHHPFVAGITHRAHIVQIPAPGEPASRRPGALPVGVRPEAGGVVARRRPCAFGGRVGVSARGPAGAAQVARGGGGGGGAALHAGRGHVAARHDRAVAPA